MLGAATRENFKNMVSLVHFGGYFDQIVSWKINTFYIKIIIIDCYEEKLPEIFLENMS